MTIASIYDFFSNTIVTFELNIMSQTSYLVLRVLQMLVLLLVLLPVIQNHGESLCYPSC